MKGQAGTIAVVGVTAVVAIAFGNSLGADRSSGISSGTVALGVVTGAVVCAAWAVARRRRASAAGLVVCAILLLGSAASVPPLVAFGQMDMTWALVTALATRFVFPAEVAGMAAEQSRPVALDHGSH